MPPQPPMARSRGEATSTTHASRHQAAEQRRRTRINERLDMLRQMVPHSERSNTAAFLEELIDYITLLKHKTEELESTVRTLKSAKAGPAAQSRNSLGGPAADGCLELKRPPPLIDELLHQPAMPESQAHLQTSWNPPIQPLQMEPMMHPIQQLQWKQIQLQAQRKQLEHMQLMQRVQQETLEREQEVILSALESQPWVIVHPSAGFRQPPVFPDLAEKLGLRPRSLDRTHEDTCCSGGDVGGGCQAPPAESARGNLNLAQAESEAQYGSALAAPAANGKGASVDAPLSVLAAAASAASDYEEASRRSAWSSPATSSERSGVPIKKRKVDTP